MKYDIHIKPPPANIHHNTMACWAFIESCRSLKTAVEKARAYSHPVILKVDTSSYKLGMVVEVIEVDQEAKL